MLSVFRALFMFRVILFVFRFLPIKTLLFIGFAFYVYLQATGGVSHQRIEGFIYQMGLGHQGVQTYRHARQITQDMREGNYLMGFNQRNMNKLQDALNSANNR